MAVFNPGITFTRTLGTDDLTTSGITLVAGTQSVFECSGGLYQQDSGRLVVPQGTRLVFTSIVGNSGVLDLQGGTLEHAATVRTGADNGFFTSGYTFRARGGQLVFSGATSNNNGILIRSQNAQAPVIDINPPTLGGPGLTVINEGDGTSDPGLNINGFSASGTYNGITYTSRFNGLVTDGCWLNIPPDATYIGVDFSAAGTRLDVTPNYQVRINPPQTNDLRTMWMSGVFPQMELFRPSRADQGANSESSRFQIVFIESAGAANANEIRIAGSPFNTQTGVNDRDKANNNRIDIVQAWRPQMLTGLGAIIQDGKIIFPGTVQLYRVPDSLDPYASPVAAVSGEIINPNGYYVINDNTTINLNQQDLRTLTYTDLSTAQNYTLKSYTHLIGSGDYQYPVVRDTTARGTGRPNVVDIKASAVDRYLELVDGFDLSTLQLANDVRASAATTDAVTPNEIYRALKRRYYENNDAQLYNDVFAGWIGSNVSTNLPITFVRDTQVTEFTFTGLVPSALRANIASTFGRSTSTNGTQIASLQGTTVNYSGAFTWDTVGLIGTTSITSTNAATVSTSFARASLTAPITTLVGSNFSNSCSVTSTTRCENFNNFEDSVMNAAIITSNAATPSITGGSIFRNHTGNVDPATSFTLTGTVTFGGAPQVYASVVTIGTHSGSGLLVRTGGNFTAGTNPSNLSSTGYDIEADNIIMGSVRLATPVGLTTAGFMRLGDGSTVSNAGSAASPFEIGTYVEADASTWNNCFITALGANANQQSFDFGANSTNSVTGGRLLGPNNFNLGTCTVDGAQLDATGSNSEIIFTRLVNCINNARIVCVSQMQLGPLMATINGSYLRSGEILGSGGMSVTGRGVPITSRTGETDANVHSLFANVSVINQTGATFFGAGARLNVVTNLTTGRVTSAAPVELIVPGILTMNGSDLTTRNELNGFTITGNPTTATLGNITMVGGNLTTTGNIRCTSAIVSTQATLIGATVFLTNTIFSPAGQNSNVTDSTVTATTGNINLATSVLTRAVMTAQTFIETRRNVTIEGGTITSTTGNIRTANFTKTSGTVVVGGNLITGTTTNTAGSIAVTGNMTPAGVTNGGDITVTGNYVSTSDINNSGMMNITGTTTGALVTNTGTLNGTGAITVNEYTQSGNASLISRGAFTESSGNTRVISGGTIDGMSSGSFIFTSKPTSNVTIRNVLSYSSGAGLWNAVTATVGIGLITVTGTEMITNSSLGTSATTSTINTGARRTSNTNITGLWQNTLFTPFTGANLDAAVPAAYTGLDRGATNRHINGGTIVGRIAITVAGSVEGYHLVADADTTGVTEIRRTGTPQFATIGPIPPTVDAQTPAGHQVYPSGAYPSDTSIILEPAPIRARLATVSNTVIPAALAGGQYIMYGEVGRTTVIQRGVIPVGGVTISRNLGVIQDSGAVPTYVVAISGTTRQTTFYVRTVVRNTAETGAIIPDVFAVPLPTDESANINTTIDIGSRTCTVPAALNSDRIEFDLQGCVGTNYADQGQTQRIFAESRNRADFLTAMNALHNVLSTTFAPTTGGNIATIPYDVMQFSDGAVNLRNPRYILSDTVNETGLQEVVGAYDTTEAFAARATERASRNVTVVGMGTDTPHVASGLRRIGLTASALNNISATVDLSTIPTRAQMRTFGDNLVQGPTGANGTDAFPDEEA